MTQKELVMYSRSSPCPFVNTARHVLAEASIPYREIFIDKDPQARQRVVEWTGFESVPTLIIALPGEDLPITEPAFLERGHSPRGIDRGSMITEPNSTQLKQWLQLHGILSAVEGKV